MEKSNRHVRTGKAPTRDIARSDKRIVDSVYDETGVLSNAIGTVEGRTGYGEHKEDEVVKKEGEQAAVDIPGRA